jgi:hypothetical protein
MASRSLALMALLTLGLLAASSVANAQPASKVYRIGTLGNENTPPWEAFRQGLRDLGYVDGRPRCSSGRIR